MKQHPVSDAHARYLRSLRRDAHCIRLSQIGILLAVLLIWEVGADLNWFDPFILSSPSRVFATVARLSADGSLWLHIGTTLLETVLGFVLGTVLGALFAVLLWWLPKLNRILDPYLVVLNALPKIALGPVLIVWIGAGMASIVVMGILVSLVVTTVTVLNGFSAAASDAHARRNEAADLYEGRSARGRAGPDLSAEDFGRHELGRRHRRRIPRFKGRSRIPDRLRWAGV